MKKLISTTDFVIANSDENSIEYKHAKTLKSKPEKCMFVPTDENGNVLEEPTRYSNDEYDTIEIQEYQTALSKVWFKGFEVKDNFDTKPTDVKHITNGIVSIFWYNSVQEWYLSRGIQTIEDLIPYNLEITENFGKNLQL